MKLTVACIQLNSQDDIAANIKAVESWVEKAARAGAELILLPENAFLMDRLSSERAYYTQSEHPAINSCIELAKKHQRWLLIGSVAVLPEGAAPAATKKMVNRSLLISPEGNVVGHYDKIHLFDVEVGDGQTYKESARILHGEKAAVAETPWGKLGMTICYDVRFPYLYRAMAKVGCDIITVPAAFTEVTGEAHWHVLLRARAIENGCFIIAPAQTGTHPGERKTFGHSLVVDPWGRILIDGGTDEGLAIVEIELNDVKKAREKIPSLMHDRPLNLV